jgi:hypothetical protein
MSLPFSKLAARRRVKEFYSHQNEETLGLLLSGAATKTEVVKVMEVDDRKRGIVRVPVKMKFEWGDLANETDDKEKDPEQVEVMINSDETEDQDNEENGAWIEVVVFENGCGTKKNIFVKERRE